jgi:hypothetical protein
VSNPREFSVSYVLYCVLYVVWNVLNGYAVMRLCGFAVMLFSGYAVRRLCGFAVTVMRLCGYFIFEF